VFPLTIQKGGKITQRRSDLIPKESLLPLVVKILLNLLLILLMVLLLLLPGIGTSNVSNALEKAILHLNVVKA